MNFSALRLQPLIDILLASYTSRISHVEVEIDNILETEEIQLGGT